jgi:hypothetical protein
MFSVIVNAGCSFDTLRPPFVTLDIFKNLFHTLLCPVDAGNTIDLLRILLPYSHPFLPQIMLKSRPKVFPQVHTDLLWDHPIIR